MKRLAGWVYAALLFGYPPELRRTHGAEMRSCARSLIAERGLRAALPLLRDLLLTVPREWGLALKGTSMRSLTTGLGRDIAYALRLLWRSPGFTLAAVVTLALGIGANTAIFSLADATLLRPVRVARPGDLHVIKFSSSYPDYLAYTEHGELFSGVVATTGMRASVSADGPGELVEGRLVSGNYFDVLGITPAAGRLLQPADDVKNGPIVAVLEYGWWQTRFGGDPGVIGRTIRLNNTAVTIVGVAREGFRGTTLAEAPRYFVPVTAAPRVQTGFFARPAMLDMRGMVWLTVIVRLKPGVTPHAGAAGLNTVYRQFHPVKEGIQPERVDLAPLRTRALGGTGDQVTKFVALLAGVVTLTLLIACANLANLLLTRSATRRREMGVRMAIGAGPGRVARQLLIESVVLAFIGAAAGLYVAGASLQLLARFQLPGGIEIAPLGLGISGAALAFTAVIATLTGVVFGTAPAWRAAHTDVLASLRDESRATSARSGLRSTLVAAQVALSLVLLVGTGLFLRSLSHSLRVPLGFDVTHVATASVNLGAARYDATRAKAFYDAALDSVLQLPGVTAASWTTVVPTTGGRIFTSAVEGYQPSADEDIEFNSHAVGVDYFRAAGTRILDGRTFTAADNASAPPVAIVNQAAARKYWAGRDPIGGRLRMRGNVWAQVVGVAEDTKVDELDEPPIPYVYLPFVQENGGGHIDPVHLLVRTSGDESALLGPMAAQLRGLDRDAPIYAVSTFAWRVRQLVMPQRMGVALFGAFAALALLLAAVGIYGVASYIAKLRTRELGIRIALGADRARIRALVLRQGAVPIAAGVVIGVVIASVFGRFAGAFLRGVTARDPLTYAAVACLLGLIALLATWLPAARASRLDPVKALRD